MSRTQPANTDRAFGIDWSKVVDTRVFLIHLFKLLVQTIEALSKNTVPQRIPFKAQEKFLEEVSADLDLLKRSRKDLLPVIYDIPVMEKPPASRILRVYSVEGEATIIFIPPNTERRISSLAENQFLSSAFKTFYRNEKARQQQLLGTLPQFYESIRLQLQPFDLELDLGRLSHYNDRENSATASSWVGLRTWLNERGVVPKEWGPKQQDFETAKLQALKEIGDALDKVISSHDVPDAEKAEFIKKTASHAVESSEARQKGVQFEEFIQQKAQALPKKGDIFPPRPNQEKTLQPPDLSEIPLYQGRRGRPRRGSPPKVSPLDFLETHYGQWLSRFSKEPDSVFQDQIRAHDPDLIKGIDNQLRMEGKGRKVRDFIKTRSARRDRELENASVEDLKRKPQLAGTLYSREKRAADKAKAAHPHFVTRK